MHEVASAVQYPLAAPGNARLACPDCGAEVQLALVSAAATVPQETAAGTALPEPAPVPRAVPESESLPDFEDSVRTYKRELIQRALQENGNVMTRAAKALGLKYTTFVAMVHRLEEDGQAD